MVAVEIKTDSDPRRPDPRDSSGAFPVGTEFFDVDGVPVANVLGGDTLSFSCSPPRLYPLHRVVTDGVALTFEEFNGLPRYPEADVVDLGKAFSLGEAVAVAHIRPTIGPIVSASDRNDDTNVIDENSGILLKVANLS